MTANNNTSCWTTSATVRVSRRGFLRSAAATSSIPATVGRTVAQRDDPGVIEVSSGEIYTKHVGTGETFSNKLIDITSANSSLQITARGSDWTVENIGIRGRQDHGTKGNGTAVITPEVEEGGTGVIRNVYIGPQYHDHSGGMLTYPGHAGELIVERCYIEGFANNSTYFSSAGRQPPAGRVTYRNCYFKNSIVAQYRTASPGCAMHNCVAVFDGKAPSGYPLGPGDIVRGCWIRAGEMDLYDSDIVIAQNHDQSGPAIAATYQPARFGQLEPPVVTLHNTRVKGALHTGTHGGSIIGESAGTPADRIPDGCPTSPDDARG